MLESSWGRRGRSSRRWQKLVTATLCAASFVSGQLLFGQQPQLTNLNTPPSATNLLPPLAGTKKATLQRVAIDAAPVQQASAEKDDGALAPILSAKDMPRPSRNKPANTAPSSPGKEPA